MDSQSPDAASQHQVRQAVVLVDNLLGHLSKKAKQGQYLFSLSDIEQDEEFDRSLLEQLEQDHKLQRLEGMLKGSHNFVSSQERRNNTVYSPPEKMELFLKNLRSCLPSLYTEKKKGKGPAQREAKPAERLAPIVLKREIAKLPEEAFLDQLFLRSALCDLILGRTELLDPVAGDAACQVRAPFILDARTLVKRLLETDSANSIRSDVEAFLKSNSLGGHAGLRTSFQVVQLRWQSEKPALFDFFSTCISAMKSELGGEGRIDCITYLALSKALTETQVAYVDEFDLPSIRHNLTVYKNPQELDKRKVALTEIACDYLLSCAKTEARLQSADNGLETALVRTLKASEASLPIGKGRRLPCLPMYAGIRAVLKHEWVQERPIVVYLKRLAFQAEDDNTPTATKGEARYSLQGMEILFYEPAEGGGYRLVEAPTPEQQAAPALSIEAWSMVDLKVPQTLVEGQPVDPGLLSPDYGDYRAALRRSDILSLVLPAAVAHAPLPGVAEAPGYDKGWQDSGRAYAENLMKKAAGNHPQSLYGEYCRHVAWLQAYDQFDLIYNLPVERSRKDERDTISMRIARNVPFTPIHIHASTFAAKQTACERLQACLAPDTEIGRRITFETSHLPREMVGDFK